MKRKQYEALEGKLPEAVVACIGGGSNAMGMFYPFVHDEEVALYGVEAAGKGVHTEKHAATLTKGSVGVLHGSMMYLLQNEEGQIQEAHSISAGLDYPGVGPEHSLLKDIGRVSYHSITDDEALEAFQLLTKRRNYSGFRKLARCRICIKISAANEERRRTCHLFIWPRR